MMTSSAQSVAKIILEGFDKHYLALERILNALKVNLKIRNILE